MRFLKGALPNISLTLTIALMVVIYLDRRNPMMGFLSGAPFFVLALLAGIASIATSVVLYSAWRKPKKRKKKAEKVSIDT
jgi:hypothetical protein